MKVERQLPYLRTCIDKYSINYKLPHEAIKSYLLMKIVIIHFWVILGIANECFEGASQVVLIECLHRN